MSQPDLEFRTAWQRQDLNLQETAIDFWSSLGILPTQVNAQDRAQELCVVAYADDLVAGVSTAVVAELPQLRNRFAFMRCAVAPGRRGQHIATALTQQSARVLSSWSEANPALRAPGMAIIVESPALAPLEKFPVWPARDADLETMAGLNLVGFTQAGQQIRVAWFTHTLID